MFSIGDFARHGRVSVRMLRHYDAIGLLRPARVDPHSGYRSYTADQLARLNRVVALKDLGFTLEQVATLLDEGQDPAALRGMLRLRRAELAAALAADQARLTQVEARLRTIESEGTMSDDVIVKALPAVRMAELTATAASFHPDDIGSVVQPLCAELGRRLESAALTCAGPLTCYYERNSGGADEVTVHAGVPVSAVNGDPNGLTIVDLPAAAQAATVVHHGAIDAVLPAWQGIARWIATSGHRSSGSPREVYLECPQDPGQWVTELQEPIA